MLRSFLVIGIPLLLSLGTFTPQLLAQDPEEVSEELWDTQLSIQGRTIFPLYWGAGLYLQASPKLRLGIDLGKTPSDYATVLGSMTTHLQGGSEYKPTIVAAFADSSLYRANIRYAFLEQNKGWSLEFGLSQMSTKGEQKIRDVARIASIGQDYQGVEAAVIAAGYRPYVTMKTKILLADIMTFYQWEFPNHIQTSVGAGFAKVMAAEVDLSTKAPGLDSTNFGIVMLGLGESDLAAAIQKYGVSPILSLDIAYLF